MIQKSSQKLAPTNTASGALMVASVSEKCWRFLLSVTERLLAAFTDPSRFEGAAAVVLVAYAALWTFTASSPRAVRTSISTWAKSWPSRGTWPGVYPKHPPLALWLAWAWFSVFFVTASLVEKEKLPERAWMPLFDAALGIRATNSRYRNDAAISELTAWRDLKRMSDCGLLAPHGERRARTYSAADLWNSSARTLGL
jgi:hypothetical protein